MSSAHLPSHWTTTTLLHIVTALEAGKSFRCIEKPPNDEEPGVVKVSAVSWGAFNEQESKTCPSEKQFNPNYQIYPGDLLISRANTIELVGACVIVGSVTKRLMLSDKILRVLTADELKPWILWYLRSCDGRAQIESRSTGNQLSMRNIGQASLLGIQIPLAPDRERFQVVEAIESYLTRLDDAMATLERVQRNLKRYRASVLKAAVEGRLVPTEAELARTEGREYEPASVLLAGILAEHRRRWEEAELAKMKAKGKVPKNDKWKAKYVEPNCPDTSELQELPEGWSWSKVDQLLSGPLANGRSVKTADAGFPVLRLTSLKSGKVDLAEHKTGAWAAEEAESYLIQEGDFLVVRGNGSIRLVGTGGIVPRVSLPMAYPDTIIRMRLSGHIESNFFAHVWNSRSIRDQIERKAKTTAGIYKVNQEDLSSCLIPLPPAKEQHRIQAELQSIFGVCDATHAYLEKSMIRCSLLRQSILKWAFEGRLVDQDPNDEPAEELLERIRAERAAGNGKKQPRTPRVNSRTASA